MPGTFIKNGTSPAELPNETFPSPTRLLRVVADQGKFTNRCQPIPLEQAGQTILHSLCWEEPSPRSPSCAEKMPAVGPECTVTDQKLSCSGMPPSAWNDRSRDNLGCHSTTPAVFIFMPKKSPSSVQKRLPRGHICPVEAISGTSPRNNLGLREKNACKALKFD